jgi:hypothetical protein
MDILRVLGLFAMIPIAGWVCLEFAAAAGDGGDKVGRGGRRRTLLRRDLALPDVCRCCSCSWFWFGRWRERR